MCERDTKLKLLVEHKAGVKQEPKVKEEHKGEDKEKEELHGDDEECEAMTQQGSSDPDWILTWSKE
jgi:hypothetical protein